jgi:hypothetical protein
MAYEVHAKNLSLSAIFSSISMDKPQGLAVVQVL